MSSIFGSDSDYDSLSSQELVKSTLIINKCMEYTFVSIQIKDEKRKHYLIELIESMSGIYCRQLTSIVTHLVIDCIQIKTHRKALSFGAQVVTDEWVIKCWKDSHFKLFNANDYSICQQFSIPLFKSKSSQKSIILVEDKIQLELKEFQDMGSNNMFANGLEWLDFEEEEINDQNRELNEEKLEIFDDTNHSNQSMDETDNSGQNGDGLDWIFDSDTNCVVTENNTILTQNQEIVEESSHTNDSNNVNEMISDLMNNIPSLTPIISGQDNQMSDSKRKRNYETNENLRFKKKVKKSSGETVNSCPISWNYNSPQFEGMPSQREYFRI